MDYYKDCEIAEKYSVKLSYPKVTVEKPNERYAKLLLNDYAGTVSELTAITQYIFHKIVLEKEYPDVSEALLGISIIEMEHLEMLGQLINDLGLPPQFRSCVRGRSVWWTASERNVDYSVSVKNALLADISAEMRAIAQYERDIELIDDEQIVCLLRRIILDEQQHIDIFSELYNRYS